MKQLQNVSLFSLWFIFSVITLSTKVVCADSDDVIFRASSSTSYYDYCYSLSPTAYFRLGESVGTTTEYDAMGGHNHTYVSAPTLGAAPLISFDANKSATFGTGKYAERPNDTALDVDGKDATWNWWMNSSNGNLATLFMKRQCSGSYYGWFVGMINNGQVCFIIDSTVLFQSEGSKVNDSKTHMVTVNYYGASALGASLFIDSVYQLGTSGIPAHASGTSSINGIYCNYSQYSWGGSADELAMWVGKCLTKTEVETLWNKGQ